LFAFNYHNKQSARDVRIYNSESKFFAIAAVIKGNGNLHENTIRVLAHHSNVAVPDKNWNTHHGPGHGALADLTEFITSKGID
jgi:hypothetical protein